MTTPVAPGARRPTAALAAAAGIVAALAAVAISGRGTGTIPYVAVLAALLLVVRDLSWRFLSALLAVVVFFVPVKRYTLPAQLPFHLEPYRLLIAVMLAGFGASLLVDRRVRLRRTGLEAPIGLLVAAILGSELTNPARLGTGGLGEEATKALLLFGAFLAIFFLLSSVQRTRADVHAFVEALVACGAILGVFAVFESRTGYNVFNHLSSYVPFLHASGPPVIPPRGGRLRVYASSQHPIALAATFVMLLPLAIYLARSTQRRRWWLAGVSMLMGALATGSRTAVVMIAVVALVYLWLRPRQVRRLWPLLIPLVVVVHFAMPGALGTMREAFFPRGGLIAQQENAAAGHARLSTLGPALHDEFAPHPILGEGFGTRVTTPDSVVPVPNAPILDDQWLGLLLETGTVGALSFLWLLVRFVRRSGSAAKRRDGPAAELHVATAAAVAAYGVGMFLYDAFSFIQVTLVFFFVLAAGCAALRNDLRAAARTA